MNKVNHIKNEIVYRVDFKPIPVGEHLYTYYIHEFSHLIHSIINKLRNSRGDLLTYLNSPDWRSLELVSSFINLDSETLKMMVVLESVFEHERQLITPELFSRLDAIFAWPTLEVAQRFKEEYIPKGVIHRCIVESGSMIEMCGDLLPPGIDLSNLNKEIFSEQLKQTAGRARTYWKQLNNPILPELLIKGRVLTESVINDH